MFKPLSLFIGLRYTRAKRKNHFISFISGSSMVGLSLGVMVLIIVLSVMNGFDRELKRRVLGMVPHATITSADGGMPAWQHLREEMLQRAGIEGAAPFVEAQGMFANGTQVRGAMTYGIEPALERTVSIIGDNMVAGELEDLKSGEFGVVLGSILADAMGVGMGDKVTLVLPEASVSLAGVMPRLKRFTVVGIFSVGAEVDGAMAYTHREDLGKFMRIPAGVNGLRLKMTDLFEAPRLVWEMANTIPGRHYVQDWTRTHGQLFQAIQMEKTMVGLLLTLIVAVAAFNIVSTLIMVVTDKQGDIAILRTFGASPQLIMAIFMMQGTLIGLIGTFVGIVLGILGALNVSAVVGFIEQVFGLRFMDPNVYFVSSLPSKLMWQDVVVIAVAGMVLSFIATLYPAWRAAQIQPAEALRYE